VVPQEFPETHDEIAMAETIAMGTAMLRKKRRREIIDGSMNRYAFDDPDTLPEWFMDDQKKHYEAPLPISEEEMAAARDQLKALDVRPIKKVAEAIARKKKRLAARLDKAKAKAKTIMDQTELDEATKMRQIAKIYKKETRLNKPKKEYVVSRRFKQTSKYQKRHGPNTVFVDGRMKTDKRAEKAAKAKLKRHRKRH
jgi:AdoMet-dependent rRNA methyltransferase SPB1